MSRYFLELTYMGGAFSGFQLQPNGMTVQSEMERALATLLRRPVGLTGSSRTDSGVHARQNYFHFDAEDLPPTLIYNLNALLPHEMAVRSIRQMPDDAHCRFDAVSREYAYHMHLHKDPFRYGRSWYYPYALDRGALAQAAEVLKEYHDFTSFSKRNTQVKTFNCSIQESYWQFGEEELVYRVRANRFLRGMVRGLVGTMLQVGRGKLDLGGFRAVIEARDCTRANFTTPAHGLFLVRVRYPWEQD